MGLLKCVKKNLQTDLSELPEEDVTIAVLKNNLFTETECVRFAECHYGLGKNKKWSQEFYKNNYKIINFII